MITRLSYLCLLLLIALGLKAQVPGYVGKRMVVSAGVTAAPALLYGIEEDLWGPNIKGKLALEWVTSRKISLCMEAWGLQAPARYANSQLESGIARLRAGGIQAGIRFYHYQRTTIPSPVGAFHELGIGYLRYSMEDLDGVYRAGQRAFGPWEDWNIHYRLGTRQIVDDWFCWEIALEAGTLISLPSTNFRSQVAPAMLGRARLIRHLMLGAHLAVGVVF